MSQHMNLYMKRALFILMLVAPLAMVGCASSDPTAYAKAEETGEEGFSHAKLSEGKYRVIFNGNRHTNKQIVRDFALLHAADLTMQQGYDWFIVTDSDSEVEKRDVVAQTHVNPQPARIDKHCGLVSCTTTIYPQSSSIDVIRTQKDGNMITTLYISMGKLPAAMPDNGYNARELAQTIRERSNG